MKYDLTLNGRGFLLDTSENSGLAGPISVPVLRPQADTGGKPGGGSLSRDDAWRAEMKSWHHGAGQKSWDGTSDSDEFRFWESRGLDVWTKTELSLLPAVDVIEDVDADVIVQQHYAQKVMVQADAEGNRLYKLVDGVPSVFWSDPNLDPTWPADSTDFFELVASDIVDMATDGTYVYLTDGTDIYRFVPSDSEVAGAVGSAWNTLDAARLWYVRGRLLAADGKTLYNITSSTPPSALYAHLNDGWAWTSAAEAGAYIYVSGNAGSQSAIYKITINDDGTALDEPVNAGALPDGEVVTCLAGYAGFLLVGTTAGVRVAQPDDSGFLVFGRNLPVGPASAFEGQDRFVWVGTYAEGTDDVSCPLWRLDLSEFTGPLTPAYARDMEGATFDKATWQKAYVSSIVTFNDKRYWSQLSDARDGLGNTVGNFIYGESDLLVAEGYIDSGEISFGVTENKVALAVEVRHGPLTASPLTGGALECYVTSDYGSPSLATGSLEEDSTSTLFDGNGNLLQTVNSVARLGLYVRAEDDQTAGPTVTSLTFRARPNPKRATEYHWPLLLSRSYVFANGGREGRSVSGDQAFVVALAEQGVTFAEFQGDLLYGFVEEFEYRPEKKTVGKATFDGVMNVKFKVVA